jgi:hypothetical protein
VRVVLIKQQLALRHGWFWRGLLVDTMQATIGPMAKCWLPHQAGWLSIC